MQKKYQVFISSTFRDLVDERQDTLKSVLDMGHIPSGMEVFPAADIAQFEYIKKIIDECDYYVLIVAARYGSMDEDGVSFTEKEYRYAVGQKKTVLAFIHGELGGVAVDKVDTDRSLQEKLIAFRQEVSRSRLVQFWKSREDLKAKVIISLHKAMSEFPALGWMRANAAASEDLLTQVNQLRLENDDLRSRMVAPFDGEEQLALPTSSFTIHYKYQYFDRNAWRKATDIAVLEWKTLWVLLAPQFMSPRKDIVVSLLVTALKEKDYVPSNRDDVDIFSTDLATIQAQLHALGLIAPEVGETTKEGRFQLTPLGQRRYLEWITVKAS